MIQNGGDTTTALLSLGSNFLATVALNLIFKNGWKNEVLNEIKRVADTQITSMLWPGIFLFFLCPILTVVCSSLRFEMSYCKRRYQSVDIRFMLTFLLCN